VHRNGRDGTPVVVVGCKADVGSREVVEAATVLCDSHGWPHMLTSSVTGENVREVFVGLTRLARAHEHRRREECGSGVVVHERAGRERVPVGRCSML
jgi:Ras family